MNFIAAGFVVIGTIFDAGVWYYVKDLKIFDHEVKKEEFELAEKEEEIDPSKPMN